jgi:hypothetical protein
MSFVYLGSIQRAPRPLPQGLQVETAPASRPIDPGGGDQGAQSDGCAVSASGKFVVVDNATKQVIQVSGPGFLPNHMAP